MDVAILLVESCMTTNLLAAHDHQRSAVGTYNGSKPSPARAVSRPSTQNPTPLQSRTPRLPGYVRMFWRRQLASTRVSTRLAISTAVAGAPQLCVVCTGTVSSRLATVTAAELLETTNATPNLRWSHSHTHKRPLSAAASVLTPTTYTFMRHNEVWSHFHLPRPQPLTSPPQRTHAALQYMQCACQMQ